MPSTREPIKALPLADKPEGISRCGMSNAKFAQHCTTGKWYELSDQGQIVGSALDLDFYRHDATQGQNSGSTVKTKELSKVS
ncbi:hypothetical protein [Acaryochloris marina]|uniref:hypothetical protein n=1 Tax=Acaryochloris marina TaxID=155978 RepID=UPI001BAE852E|nr:hypothetical protein [Acaryochloris marina]QUY45758.1 hypothetical protein I1H34_28835 [Acaryochloris marina S15]